MGVYNFFTLKETETQSDGNFPISHQPLPETREGLMTTNRNGVYKMDIPSVDGINCAKEAQFLNTCRASLIRSTSPACNVPAFVSTSNEFSVKSKEANLCIYSLYALSFKPSKKDLKLCGK
nr:pollen-specific protein-like At4g18596 [Tanacetum cinerariifolium]